MSWRGGRTGEWKPTLQPIKHRRPVDDRPLVSIVTPVLNRASVLRVCLASVAAQTYPRVEHIVVDGGSTDGTIDVLKSFSSSSLRWITGKDEGMYDAVNRGIRMAEGQVLGYLNSDDLYFPWSIEVAVAEINKGADLIFGDLAVLEILGKSRRRLYVQFYPPFDLCYYTHTATLAQPTVFWRRTITEEVGQFDQAYRLIADCDYWIRVGRSGARITHVDEILAIQVDHADTLRETQSERLAAEFGRLRARYASQVPPPRYPRFEAWKKSAQWRLSQWTFVLTGTIPRPRRWRRLIAFLRENEIRLNRLGTLFFFTLPARLRPKWAASVDTSTFETELCREIGVVSGSLFSTATGD
jgi:glycosyltransferase involved in cell wall biosynthesis